MHEENLSQENSHGKSGLSSVMVFYLEDAAEECHKHHNQASSIIFGNREIHNCSI